MSISIVIGTYGDDVWRERATVAYESAIHQTCPAVDITHVHGATLAQARNTGAERAQGDWLVFLDADDTLDPGYVAAMSEHAGETPLLLQPATLGVHPDGREDPYPVVIPQRPLEMGNFMVIGTALRRDQFHRIGGFREWPLYEDWCLFIRAWRDGAGFQPVPAAIYRVGVNDNGRNNPTERDKQRTFRQIRKEYFR